MSREGLRDAILGGFVDRLTPELAYEALERYGSISRAAEALGYSRTHLRRVLREQPPQQKDGPVARVLCPKCGEEIASLCRSGRIQLTNALVKSP